MSHERIGEVRPLRTPAADSRERTPQGAARRAAVESFIWGVVIVVLSTANFAVHHLALRRDVLRGVLILAAIGEGLGAVANVLRPRWFAERNGRPYAPAYHGVSQDFGFYNLGFALLFGVAACDPLGAVSVIAIASVVYVIHGLTHVLRYFALYYGDGTPMPTRPQVFEMRDGLQLLAAAIGMMLFAG